MLRTLKVLRIVTNYNLSFLRNSTNFELALDQAMEQQTEKAKEKKEQLKVKKERYNGKVRRRDWVEETEEAKKARLEANPVDRVKRKKSVVLLGFSGVNYHGMQRNTGVKTVEDELLKAFLKNGWINDEGFNNPQQAFFQRASRTDKGVSAARQIVSLKLPATVDIDALNKDLPEDIRVFAVKRVTQGFNSKTTCDARSYSYTLPTYTFTKDGEEYCDKTFRLSPERLEELNKILSMYLGSKNFHNFTVDKKPYDQSALRFIISFECQKPFIPDNTEVEFARLKITGQSFMMHQIRKMVGVVIAIMRGYLDADFINRATQKERFLIFHAPGLGLVLDNVHYTRYNERYGSDGVHEPLTFDKEEPIVEEFFRKHIMSTIIETELKDEPMLQYIGRLRKHSYEMTDRLEDKLVAEVDEEKIECNTSD